jgi:hypothetical protein
MPFVLFVIAAVVSALAQGTFLRALARRDPSAFVTDDDVMRQMDQPIRFVALAVDTTASRLSAVAHVSPYPEVERLRRFALLAIAVAVAALVYVAASN